MKSAYLSFFFSFSFSFSFFYSFLLRLIDSLPRNPCPNNLQDWCVGARLVFGDAQNSGDYAPAPVGSKLGVSSQYLSFPPLLSHIHHLSHMLKKKTVTYDPPSKKHNIAVTVNGKLVSSLPPTSPDNLGKSPSPPKNPPFSPNPIN